MSQEIVIQRRSISLLCLFGTILLVIAAWNLPDNAGH